MMAVSSINKKCGCRYVLCKAVMKDDVNFIRKSLKKKPELIIESEFLHLFQKMVSRKMVSVFFHHCGDKILQCFDRHRKSILVYAFHFNKNIEIIKEIILFNKDTVNRTDARDVTPLNFFVSRGADAELVKYLILNDADVNKSCASGTSPLHHANELDIVNILIEAGANINAKDNQGITPLMEALYERRRKEIILKLIKHGADLNDASDRYGWIPLHYAFMGGYEQDVIYEIFNKTANVNTLDKCGRTPLCLGLNNFDDDSCNAALYKKEFIFDLINKGAVINFDLFRRLLQQRRYSEIAKGFIDCGYDVRSVNSSGSGVLHCVKDEKLVSLLVRNGASVNLKNSNGDTPLVYAMSRGNIPLVKSLLWHGSNPDDGLDYYLRSGSHLSPCKDEILSELVLYGANVSLKNEKLKKLFVKSFYCTVNGLRHCPLILKYLFINNENVTGLDFPGIDEISMTYKHELDKMKSVNILPNLSVYEFCIKHYKSTRCHINTTENMLVKDDYQNMKSLFPIFCDQIKTKIKINIKTQNRIKLLNKLFNISVKTLIKSNDKGDNYEPLSVVDGSLPADHIQLDSDILYHYISGYLSDFDLNCLIYAAVMD